MPAPGTHAAPPDWTSATHPLWRWLIAACAAANALPLWAGNHLPFTDLPQHAAAIATLRHFWDPAWKAQQYFTLALSQTQYLLYYLAGAILAVPLGTAERANLVLLSCVGAAFPFALRALARALRADPRVALFAAPLFWSQPLLIGFFNYLAALPLLLWGLALAVRHAEAPARRTAWLLAGTSLGLFYLHLSAFLFFAPAAALAAFFLPRPPEVSPRGLARALMRLPARLAWMIPGACAALVFLWKSPVVDPGAAGWQGPRRVVFEDFGSALHNLPAALTDIWTGSAGAGCLLALGFAFALAVASGKRGAAEPDQDFRRGLVLAWVFFAVALYFLFPQSIGWLWQLNERYAVLAALLVPLLLRPAPGPRGAVPLLLAAAISAAAGGIARSHIAAFDAEVGGFDAVIARAQPGKRMIGLIYDWSSATARFSPYLHFASLYRARAGGMASFSFAELPQSPLRYRPEAAPPPKPEGWEWHPEAYRSAVDGPYYDYVLVRGRRGFDQREGPRFLPIARSGLWTLYAKE
ncbi:MAG: hypothetical protein NVS2B9_04920 [Myxococcales bacterium]